MKKNPLKKIENELNFAQNVLLLTDGKDQPQKRHIRALEKRVDNLTPRRNINRSTRQSIENNTFCMILTFRGGFFMPHPEYSPV